eukprot:Transcript_5225.p1 GENE.Transcript_5225~~Transcript_5225.p1  ORF type:complete len:535 (-),score=204.24 Transcript_5225:172-1623(-)
MGKGKSSKPRRAANQQHPDAQPTTEEAPDDALYRGQPSQSSPEGEATGLDCPEAPWGAPCEMETTLRAWMPAGMWLNAVKTDATSFKFAETRSSLFRSLIDSLIFEQPERRVALHGLKSRPELNGTVAFVLGKHKEHENAERYPVEVRQRGQVEKLMVKVQNLRPYTEKLFMVQRASGMKQEHGVHFVQRVRAANKQTLVAAKSPLAPDDPNSAGFDGEARRREREAEGCYTPCRHVPHASTGVGLSDELDPHALDGDELIGEIRRRKRQLLSARLAGTLTWADLDEQDEFLAFWPPKLTAERIALETKRKKLERDVREATGNTRASVRSRAQELLLGEARARLTAHIREKMTVFNEKTRIFNNEHFWFQYWEARVAWQDTLFLKMREEVLRDVVYDEDGKPQVRIAEEEAQLDAAFDKSFDELLAEMKDGGGVDYSALPPPEDAPEQSSMERRAKDPVTVVRRVAGAQFEFDRIGKVPVKKQ